MSIILILLLVVLLTGWGTGPYAGYGGPYAGGGLGLVLLVVVVLSLLGRL